jgi:hypothetical protein
MSMTLATESEQLVGPSRNIPPTVPVKRVARYKPHDGVVGFLRARLAGPVETIRTCGSCGSDLADNRIAVCQHCLSHGSIVWLCYHSKEDEQELTRMINLHGGVEALGRHFRV